MRLSKDQASHLYNHLFNWFKAIPQHKDLHDLRASSHILAASIVFKAAEELHLLGFLRFLDNDLKHIVASVVSQQSLYPSIRGTRPGNTLTPKDIGYSYKDLRWQILIWLGSCFDMNDPEPGESTKNVEADHLIIDELIGSVDEEAGNFSGPDTHAMMRLKFTNLYLDEEDSMIMRERLEDDGPFPYVKWEVVEWALVEGGTGQPAILTAARTYQPRPIIPTMADVLTPTSDKAVGVVAAHPDTTPTWAPGPVTKKELAAAKSRLKKISAKKPSKKDEDQIVRVKNIASRMSK